MKLLFLFTIVAGIAIAFAGENSTSHFSGLEHYIGKTWQGEFANSTPENPVIDISHWELILNGQAIRVMHSVNNGEYGGESIIYPTAEPGKLEYYYFTTAGFYTHGFFEVDPDSIVAVEDVTGSKEGITQVRSVTRIQPDGQMQVVSRYLKKGAWVPGHQINYREAPDALVKFKGD
jgi:hypothetical protein